MSNSAANGKSNGGVNDVPFSPVDPGVSRYLQDLVDSLDLAKKKAEEIDRLQKGDSNSGLLQDAKLKEEVTSLTTKIKGAKDTQSKELREMKNWVEQKLKGEVVQGLSKDIDKHIDDEIRNQVQEKIKNWPDAQALAESLRKVVQENDKMLEAAAWELKNSENRQFNSRNFDGRNNSDLLKEIVDSAGNLSKNWPKTIDDLFDYSEEKLVNLLKDYDLEDTKSEWIDNMNKFLAFIGCNTLQV